MRMHDVRWMLLLAAVLGACTCDGPVASVAHEVVAPAATDVPCFYPEGACRCAVPGPSCRGACPAVHACVNGQWIEEQGECLPLP